MAQGFEPPGFYGTTLPGLVPEQAPAESTFGKDVTSAAGGLAPTISAGIFRRRKRKQARKQRQFERGERQYRLGEGLTDLAEQEAHIQRQAAREPSAIKAAMAGIGAVGGSQEKTALEDQKYNLARRLNSIQRARARLKHGYEAGERFAALQKQAERLERNEAKLAAFIDLGTKVAGAAL